MASLLADRLRAVRHRQFVGRTSETFLFQSAVESTELPYHVLHLFGPGGVGKTTLLKEFARLAEKAGATATYLDARNIEPAPPAFLNALRGSLDLAAADSPMPILAARPERQVILIDTYETLEPLDTWLREEFLPQLSENMLVVTAGRNTPAPGWRIDPGWQELVRTLPLRNLDAEETHEYLTRRSVPAEQHRTVIEFTHGHPLALSLIADTFAQRGDTRFQPQSVPDIIKTLLEQFVQKVPGPAHRAALECCGLVRVTTETLLSEMLAIPDVHELFEWLRSLSFIESGAEGLFPHDLAREALVADLRWRNPDWYVELHHRARGYYAGKLQQSHSHEQQRLLFDYVFLHRENSVVRSMFQWQGAATSLADAAERSDWPTLRAMVAQFEGEESAEIASFWFDRQPQGAFVLRDPEGKIVGFLMMVALHLATPEDIARDPAARAAKSYLDRHAPLRPGEGSTLFRFWMGRDTYHAVSPVQSLIFVNVARHYLTTPGLAFTFFPTVDPDFWAQGFAYVDLHRLQEADYEVTGKRYGVYGHDWRTVPPVQWLALLAEREIGAAPEQTPAAESRQIVVLSESMFADAVLDALRTYVRADELAENPLVYSRLIAERDVSGDRVETLRTTIRETAESLQASPRDAKCYRALYRTYLNPAATQERAAELLDLPFSTYRRHLKAGIEQLTKLLWQQEIGRN